MIKIIAVGKVKEKYLQDGINEYLKRCEGYQKVQIIEAKESTTNDINKNLLLEGKDIIAKLGHDDYIITLEILGQEIDSVELAKKLNTLQTYGATNITFIIGGSWGLSDEVKKMSKLALSFSKMTFPHQLMRLILMEQIYRSQTIINNKEYHK